MIEIERKFLVQSDEFIQQATKKSTVVQGYLSKDPNRTVRVRIKDQKSFLTIKGKSNASGMSRYEWEKEIPLSEGKELIKLSLPKVIEKTRYFVPYEGNMFEVDIFEGIHKGLILAEIELNSELEEIKLPAWIGKEVTGDPKYYNASLSSIVAKNS